MPLREDLLEPIPGENPSGENLYYDKVFDQLKEARREEEEGIPEGPWARTQKKKADYPQVRKLSGDSLAKRSKDLRFVAWYCEAEFKLEGLEELAPCLELLLSIQEAFWATLHPEIEDGNDMELRILAVNALAKELSAAVQRSALTRSGLDFETYQESRVVGYEKDAVTSQKKEARKKAIDEGQVCAEDFDRAVAVTPKSFYVELDGHLADSIALIARLNEFHEEKYGDDDKPNLNNFSEVLERIHSLSSTLLEEKLRLEPDVKPKTEQELAEAQALANDLARAISGDSQGQAGLAGRDSLLAAGAIGEVAALSDAYRLVVRSAEFFFDADPTSPVPYLVCAGLRLGETRMQGATPAAGFAVGPSSAVRQSMRSLAGKGLWKDLLRASLPVLAAECSRAWLDMHRYIWKAAEETGATALSQAVVGTMKSLLEVRPELRHWTLEDDTGAANPETQQWLDTVVRAS